MSHQNKYLKYKNKYLDLKNKIGGVGCGAGGGGNHPFSTGFSPSPNSVVTSSHLQHSNSNNTIASDTSLFVSNITFEDFTPLKI
jgi:hypothetical protein